MLKRILLMLALLGVVSVMTGCFHAQIITDKNYNAAKSTPDFTTNTFHIIGLIGVGADINLSEICPNGTGLVENKTIFKPLLGMEKVNVYCK